MPAALFFSVSLQDGAWSVEHQGRFSNRSREKAEVVASATKLARAAATGGQTAQVRIEGETGYFPHGRD